MRRVADLPLVLPGQLGLPGLAADVPPAPKPAPDVLVVDCPWKFGDSLPGDTRGASKQYACLDVGALRAFSLPEVQKNAVMFFWRVSAMQEEALEVVRAWGFKVKSELVWLKTTATGKRSFGMGRYVRMSHEVCLICVRGSAMPELHNVRSVFEAPVGRHSAKPDAFYDVVESLYPRSRKVELFARTVRSGWEQHGDQLGTAVPANNQEAV